MGLLIILTVSNGTLLPAAVPDLTNGDTIPEGWDQDWNLGATGLRGWMYSDRLETSDARQIAVTAVHAGSPAAGLFEIGDVILGVGGSLFSYDPREEFGRALTQAESLAGGGSLVVTRWRGGVTADVELTLPVMGDYGANAPYGCPKSALIVEQAAAQLAARMASDDYRGDHIVRSINALGLLAAGKPEHLPLIKAQAENIISQRREGFATWYYGNALVFVSQYVLATGDMDVMPELERMALESARGQSAVGTWGHRFADENARLYGYGTVNMAALPLQLGLILARKAGVSHPDLDTAIQKSTDFFRFYVDKGSVPYGDHESFIRVHDDNGKSSLAAVVFRHLEDDKAAAYFARLSLASHGPERDMGHTGVYFNMFWALPAVSLLGKRATGAWMEAFGSWHFDLARQWDGGFDYLGQPARYRDKYANWDATGAYLLAFALPLGHIALTHPEVVHDGEEPFLTPLTRIEADSVINDGRGWSPKDPEGYYDSLSSRELMNRLGSWSITVRDRAVGALHRRRFTIEDWVVPELIIMLESGTIEQRLGACEILGRYGGHYAADAASIIISTIDDEHMWLRVQAVEALGGFTDEAQAQGVLPKLLFMVSRGPTEEDPRGMEQRFLARPIFTNLLRKLIESADMDQVRRAVIALLQNQDGHARGHLRFTLDELSYEQIRPLLPVIAEAVATPSPSGVMFSNTIRMEGIQILAKHRIEEGMELALDMMDVNQWGDKDRIDAGLAALHQYEGSAKHLLPRIRGLKEELETLNPTAFAAQIEATQALINSLETTVFTVVLRQLDDYRWMSLSTPTGNFVDILPATDLTGHRELDDAEVHSFDALSPNEDHVLEILAAPPG